MGGGRDFRGGNSEIHEFIIHKQIPDLQILRNLIYVFIYYCCAGGGDCKE